VEDNAPEEVAVALEVENADFEVNADQAVVLDDQDVLIDVQDLEIDDQEVAPYALVVDHEEVVPSESYVPYSRCFHYVQIEHAPVSGENYSSQQEEAADAVFVQEEVAQASDQAGVVERVPVAEEADAQAFVQEEAVNQVLVAEEVDAQIPAHVLESFHRVQRAYHNWLANMSHTVSLFQGRKFGFLCCHYL